MTTANCTLTAAGYGSHAVIVNSIDHGMSVVASEARGRNARALYSRKRTSGSFSMQIQFPSWQEYHDFGMWLQEYGRRVSDPDDATIGAIRVQCAARGFDKVAVPRSGVTCGDAVGAVTYAMNLDFVGTSSPLEYDSKLLAEFKNSRHDTSNSKYYYPAGIQLGAGNVAIDGQVYDTPQHRTLVPMGPDGLRVYDPPPETDRPNRDDLLFGRLVD